MCYRCELCRVIVSHGEVQRKHAVYREVTKQVWERVPGSIQPVLRNATMQQIDREYNVCAECLDTLQIVPLPTLQDWLRNGKVQRT